MMNRLIITITLLFNVLFSQGQDISKYEAGSPTTYNYHSPSMDKPSWQRLNLWLSATFYRGAKQSRVDMDSSLIYTSKSLGLSRLSFAAEGIDDPELFAESKWFDEREPGKGIHLLSGAKGKKHLELLILLGAYYTFQPANYQRYRDSVEYFLNKAVAESKAIGEKRLYRVTLCLLGKIYVQGSDTTNGNAVFRQLINECREAADKRTEAMAFAYRGLYSAYPATSLDDKISYFQKAAEMYHRLDNTEGEICVMTNIGFLNFAAQRLEDARNGFLKALQLENIIGYPYTHYSTDQIVMISMFEGRFGEPLKYALESVKAAERSRDSIGWAYFYLRLGQLYLMEGDRQEEALKWMRKALDRHVINHDGGVSTTLYNIISMMNESKGREAEALELAWAVYRKTPPQSASQEFDYKISFANCYISLKQFDLAEQCIMAADSIQKHSPGIPIIGAYQRTSINTLWTSLHFAKAEFTAAKKYLENYLADSVGPSVMQNDIFAYQRLIYIDSVFQDAPSAVIHYKQYMQLADSSFKASKMRQAEELQVVYQTQEKEDKIILLNQQAKFEHANLKQATLTRNLTIAGIFLVLVIAALLYRQNKMKQKNNVVITHKNELLQHLLTEKEWLLKEIHHRVKNNFQTVMGLLGTQSQYLKNEVAIDAITDSQRRIQAMSLIHQRLYQSNNLSAIKMPDYVHELVNSLSDSFNTNNRIRFNLQIEPMELDLAHCIPLGLIMNEAITNAFKYAFPNEKEGIISIAFNRTLVNRFLLTIKDNGVGLPPAFNILNTNSMGMNLMRGLCQEIGAAFTIHNQNGTRLDISFIYEAEITNAISQNNVQAA